MDAQLYKQMFTSYWKLFIGIIVLVMLFTWFLVATRPTMYQGSAYLSVAQPPQTITSEVYQYDQFYTLQGSGFLTRLLESWLKDPATVNQIFTSQKLEAKISGLNLNQLSRLLKPEVKGNNGLQIHYSDQDQATVQTVLSSTQTTLTDRLAQYQGQGFYQGFSLLSNEPLIIEDQADTNLYLLLSFIGGTILGFIILLGITVFKHPNS